MKNMKKTGLLQKIIITIVITLLLSNFIVPTYSHADWGGVLMDPITDFLCTIGDAVINLLQKCMTGDWGAGFSLDGGFLTNAKEYSFDTSITEASADIATYPNGDANGENEFNKTAITGKTQDYYVPTATYSPEQIFAGNVAGLDINFINPNKYAGQKDSTASELRPVIASWYVALRNLAVVGLLSVLVYVGIRIILSSTAADKAKYKQMFTDWLIALCLLFFLHYIMSFVITLVESITQAIGGNGTNTLTIYVDGEGGGFSTNLLGAARFQTQYNDFGQKVAYLIMYLALVIYTCIFTFFYLKRLLMMAFLTLIAPLVALTYPIDKMNDGKAQAFDAWLKEYVFNALIQPFHLIIYTVFVGSAIELATNNIIYMIAVLGFIMPAEKILRKFFGFDKAGAGTLGALGTLGLASMAQKALGLRGGKGGNKAPGGKQTPEGEKTPRFEKKHDINEIGNGEDDGTGLENDSNGRNMEINFKDTEIRNSQFGNDMVEDATFGDSNSGIILPDSYKQRQQQETARKAKEQQEAARKAQEQQTQQGNTNKNKDKFKNLKNWTRDDRSAFRASGRAIKGAVKFGTKTAFKAGAGTLAAAVTLASGGGFAGASAAFMTGSNVGGKLGNAAINLGTHVAHGAGRVGRAFAADFTAANSEDGLRAAENALLGGTRFGRELDLAHGDTRYQTAGGIQEFKQDKNNIQYLREQIAAQNGGAMPSAKELKAQMNSFDPYLAEGLTDIKDMLKAQKAEMYTGSAKQSAIIAAIGKERGITADILNDDKKARAQQANLKQDFINKGYSDSSAAQQAEYTMNVLKVQNGVANNLQKLQATQQPKQVKAPKAKK